MVSVAEPVSLHEARRTRSLADFLLTDASVTEVNFRRESNLWHVHSFNLRSHWSTRTFCRYIYLFDQPNQLKDDGMVVFAPCLFMYLINWCLSYNTGFCNGCITNRFYTPTFKLLLKKQCYSENDKHFRFVITFIFYHRARNKIIIYMTHFLNFANTILWCSRY